MHDKVEISVIMGVYNSEKTLDKCIKSIIEQTFSNWELILCNDFSSDSSLSILEKYQRLYPQKIKIINNDKNIGLAASLNKCLSLSKGKYIARMDSDDYCEKNRLECQYNFLENNPEYDVVGTNMYTFDENGIVGIRGTSKIVTNMPLSNLPFAHPTIMMKKEVYDTLNGYTVSTLTRRCEDLDLWFRFFANNFKGYNIQKPLYYYKETLVDFKRRKVTDAIKTSIVCFKGYRLLDVPKYKYIFAIKPIICSLIPSVIMKKIHFKKNRSVKNDK